MKIHILGIGGTFMAGVAIIAKQLGHTVTGSDKNLYDPMKSVLIKEGIKFTEGYNSNILKKKIDLVIVGNVMSTLLTFAGALGSFIFNMIMVIIFTIILLLNYHQFKKSLVGFIPNKYFEVGLRLIYNIEQQVSNYLRGQLLAATSVAIMSIIGLYILNFFGANLTLVIFIGIIAGLANLIPLVGPFIGMLIAFAVALMNNLGNEAAQAHMLFNAIPSPFYILDVALMFIIVQQVDNNFITPLLVGESVGLHPIMVMIALLIGGTLIGPMGMLFAVPAAGIIKVIGHEISFVTKNAHLL